MLVIILIIILIFLILQNFLYKTNSVFENLDNQTSTNDNNKPCDANSNPLFLALKNAANISALQSKISEFGNLKEELDKIQYQVNSNTKGLTGITHQISKVGKIHVKKS